MKNRLKSELARLPAKLPDRVTATLSSIGFDTVHSKVGNRISNTALVEVEYGDLQFVLEADLGNPSRTIQREGIYEPAITEKIVDIVESDDCFVNVGASFGYFPLLVSQITQPGLVYGIEPNPETREIFERNNDRVTDGQIHVSPYFVGNDAGDRNIPLTVYSGLPAGEAKTISVEAREISLDTFVDENDLVPDVILADIDGGEYRMLQGAEHILADHRPRLLVELHPEILAADEEASVAGILELLRLNDYSIQMAETYVKDYPDWESEYDRDMMKPFHIFAEPNE